MSKRLQEIIMTAIVRTPSALNCRVVDNGAACARSVVSKRK